MAHFICNVRFHTDSVRVSESLTLVDMLGAGKKREPFFTRSYNT